MVKQASWAEIAATIGLSESMIYQVKAGKKELSPKALYRLLAAESAVGILPDPRQALKARFEEIESRVREEGGTQEEQDLNFNARALRSVATENTWRVWALKGEEELSDLKKTLLSVGQKISVRYTPKRKPRP